MVIKPLEEDLTPATVKPFQVSLVEPVAYQFQLSFTYARNIVLDGYPKVLAARGAKRQQQELEDIIDLVARCRLPKRTKRRSYPREVWGRGYRFPIRRREKTK